MRRSACRWLGIAALSVGIAQAALEAGLAHACERRQFDRPILDDQGPSSTVAEMVEDGRALRRPVRDAAARLDPGERAALACSTAKCSASDVAMRVTQDAVQLLRGSGSIRGSEMERLYHDAEICRICEWTNPIQREIIAGELLAAAEGGRRAESEAEERPCPRQSGWSRTAGSCPMPSAACTASRVR